MAIRLFTTLKASPTTKRRGSKIVLLITVGNVHRRNLIARFQFSLEGLSIAEKTIEKFLARELIRLYEQEREEPCGSSRLGLYVQRWGRWLRGIASVNTHTMKSN